MMSLPIMDSIPPDSIPPDSTHPWIEPTPSQTPGQHPSPQLVPLPEQQAGGAHPTAMLSCMGFYLSFCNSFFFFMEACISLVGTLCTSESL